MKKISILLAGLIISFSTLAQDTTARKLEELTDAFYQAGRFNGSVLIATQGKILLQKGYGIKNADQHSANDANSIYQIASITKSFTSTLILKMVELKKLSLDDPLSRFFKGFVHGDSITIRMLLNHTSGIHNLTETDSFFTVADEAGHLAFIKSLPADFLPGQGWHYSNSGYIILGYVATKAAGMSYWQAIRKYIFEPLQMNNSGFDFAHLAAKEKSQGYDMLNATESRPAYTTDSTVPFAAGSIYSSVPDLYKFHRGLQQYKIVPAHIMNRAYERAEQNSYGFGWQIDSVLGKKMVSHSGSISGFGSNFARITADDVCIILLSNKSGSTFETINMTDRLLAALYGHPYKIPVKRIPVALSEDVLKSYEGTYEIAEPHLIVEINLENGKLIARPHRGPPSPLLAVNNVVFYSETDEELEIIFGRDAAGKVIQLTVNMRDKTRIAKKIK